MGTGRARSECPSVRDSWPHLHRMAEVVVICMKDSREAEDEEGRTARIALKIQAACSSGSA